VCFAIEWPRHCDYWKYTAYIAFAQRYQLQTTRFDGCMYGLVATAGKFAGLPIMKPWRVDSNCHALVQQLQLRCNGSHQHAPCAGRDTRLSEAYTDAIAETVHQCWAQHQQQRSSNSANLLSGVSVLRARLASCVVRSASPLAPPRAMQSQHPMPVVAGDAEAQGVVGTGAVTSGVGPSALRRRLPCPCQRRRCGAFRRRCRSWCRR
jgi:hypothetical protein